jgi:heme-degrading monooxygenase HmoA
MITVANRLYVKPEYADAFETVFRERAGLVDKMEGFISNQILRPVNPAILTWFLRRGTAGKIFSTGCAPTRL